MDVVTPTGTLGVRGTKFVAAVDEDKTTRVAVYEGVVEVTANDETVTLSAQETAHCLNVSDSLRYGDNPVGDDSVRLSLAHGVNELYIGSTVAWPEGERTRATTRTARRRSDSGNGA